MATSQTINGLLLITTAYLAAATTNKVNYIQNKSAPIQLAQCWFPGLAISIAKILIFFQIKYTEAVLSNSTRKLLWFEITKMLINKAK